jgi:hypothetical protein
VRKCNDDVGNLLGIAVVVRKEVADGCIENFALVITVRLLVDNLANLVVCFD